MVDNAIKSDEGQCASYRNADDTRELARCIHKGVRRYDHGLDSGIHCDECWDKMIFECRQRSW